MEFGLGWIGDKGAGQIGKVTSLGDSVKLTKFSGDTPYISSHLPLKDRFAFAGGDGLRSRFDTPDFKQAEEKLSTYQFASSGRINSSRTNGGNVPYSFDSSLMEHLFHGELKQKWWGLKAVGYHHESMMGGGEIVRITHAPNSAGVYRAKVKVDGETKNALSSFFPKDWDRVQVLDSIKEAYDNKIQVDTVRYVGQTSHGFKVEMIIQNNEIITAYPVYTRRQKMKYTYEFYRDGLGGLRIRLPKEISIISHFLEDILDDEADEYIQILDKVVDQKVPQYEIEGNVAAVYIEPNYTSAINLFMSAPNNQCKIETSEFRKLLVLWRDTLVAEGKDIEV
ncbi:TPA: EndoU domain-containing protein [Bacillus thuringiensis]|nr:hypothetical protein C621_0214170 [Bacillus thuringiensis serovar aizawai str. Leapi01]ETE99427.1 hypothetical protein C623_0204240 [Bacillus thuringiensis serovar aizawai str. Hu4-2]KLA09028.1 hypothetical protein B4158_3150 [Bacillus cereus]MCC3882411.1 EndoU domain-containing protein [Bacillus thuringiensis]MCC3894782.1 EndoU domain-containing protein [Bacillus thuringiensis]